MSGSGSGSGSVLVSQLFAHSSIIWFRPGDCDERASRVSGVNGSGEARDVGRKVELLLGLRRFGEDGEDGEDGRLCV